MNGVCMSSRILLATAAIGILNFSLSAAAASAKAQPAHDLIPRKLIFGNPTRTAATISPDGQHIAFLAPRYGVLNIWVAPTGRMAEAQPLSTEKERPIVQFFWAPDSSRVLYLQDKGGTEDFLLYGVSLANKSTVTYTRFAKTHVVVVRISPLVRDEILIGLNNRDPKWHDIYRLNPATGALKLVWKNPGGYAGVVADRQLNLVIAEKALPDGGTQLERFGQNAALTPIMKWGLEDALTTSVISASDPGHVYMLNSRGRNTAALTVLASATGFVTVLGQDVRADVNDGVIDPRSGTFELYGVEYLQERWSGLTPRGKADVAFLDKEARGQWSVASQSDDDRLWTIAVDRVSEPAAYYLYDRSERTLTQLFTVRPELEGRALAGMHALEIKARDGLNLVSYLSLPPGSDPDGNEIPTHPLPMVLFVHGGPWARDSYGYNGDHQWLANRGYAVLSVNYRASTGFGKAFVEAGNLQWGRKMHDDLLDAVQYAVEHNITTADEVAIMGGSYGGYATLAGVTMTPSKFRCGVDIVGPSNLFTLLQTIPPYWAAAYEQFAQRMGDPRTAAGRTLLKERSPLTYAGQIKVPLLIGQGANDPRVNQRESDQIVSAMKAKSIPVTYVLYPDEGHGFRRPENRISFNAVTEGFLARCLGGASEAIGDDFKGSSIQVPQGAGAVNGLPQALAALKLAHK